MAYITDLTVFNQCPFVRGTTGDRWILPHKGWLDKPFKFRDISRDFVGRIEWYHETSKYVFEIFNNQRNFRSIRHCTCWWKDLVLALQWRHNERDVIWNHRLLDCLLYSLFRRISKKTSKLCYWPQWGESTGDSPRKGPGTRKIFPFNDVVMEHL